MSSVSAGVLLRYFNAIQYSNSGKDKVLRLIQYTLRLLSRVLSKHSLAHLLEKFLNRVNNLESAISVSRNVFSFGNSLESLIGALDALAIADDSLRVWSVIAQSAKFVHLSADHLNLIQKIKVAHISDALSLWVNRLWILSSVLSIAKNLRRFSLLSGSVVPLFIFSETVRKRIMGDDSGYSTGIAFFHPKLPCPSKGSSQIQEARLNFYKDVLDLTCPLSNLGYIQSEIGALSGIVSSIIGLMQIIRKYN